MNEGCHLGLGWRLLLFTKGFAKLEAWGSFDCAAGGDFWLWTVNVNLSAGAAIQSENPTLMPLSDGVRSPADSAQPTPHTLTSCCHTFRPPKWHNKSYDDDDEMTTCN
jgi:hypothetical protein